MFRGLRVKEVTNLHMCELHQKLKEKYFLGKKDLEILNTELSTIEINLKEEKNSINKKESKINELNTSSKKNEEEIIEYSNAKEKLLKYSKWSIIGAIIRKINGFSKKYPNMTYIESKLDFALKDQKKKNELKVSIEKQILDHKENIQLLNGKEKDIKNKINDLNIARNESEYKMNLIDELNSKFNSLAKEIGLESDLFIKEYKIYNSKIIVDKRHKLFKLSLRITEEYIKKHRKRIVYNLKKIYEDNWFKSYYKPNFVYPQEYIEAIKAVWETLFLCFPVVTTTLHSFSKKTFHMIEGIFDTIMVDEAGQILPHMLVAPLYRTRKAIVVGDVFQLEPVRACEENLIEKYDFQDEIKDQICIEKNSAQDYADRNSDAFEFLSDKKVGIVLEEHRRCEDSIVEFSNKYVYDSKLKIVKEDNEKELFGKNLCFFDVRGKKSKQHINRAEIEICKRIIKELIDKYGEDYRKNIGIIAPFKNHVNQLKKEIDGISIGTVHTFQGQEKKVIIFSTVLDDQSNKGLQGFVANKPNLLNVAFTRAKEQLIIIGNLEVYKKSSNYLSKAFETIIKRGCIYSIYDMNYTENIKSEYLYQGLKVFLSNKVSQSCIGKFIAKNYDKNLIVGPKEHYEFLKFSISNSQKGVCIVSPWISPYLVNNEFLELIKNEKEKLIRICFGYSSTPYNLEQIEKITEIDNKNCSAEAANAIKSIKKIIGKELQYKPPIHTKALIIDDEYMIIGSHNWLSNNGRNTGGRDEISCIITDKDMINYVREKYFSKESPLG